MVLAGTLLALANGACAQTNDSKVVETKSGDDYQTFYLANVTRQNDANDLQTAVRNMVPRAKVYYVESLGALTVRGSAEDLQLVQRMIADLDRTRKVYRLIYTITSTEGGKAAESQHFALIVAAGNKSVFKQGSKVPIMIGTVGAGGKAPEEQVQYLDVGLNVEAQLEGFQDGVRLKTKVEESAVAEEKSGIGAQDPVVRQTMLEATSALTQGKPVVLGTMEMPGSTRHLEIAVTAEAVR
jgi:type II secretory pathway component GspD/PulD (secretin)